MEALSFNDEIDFLEVNKTGDFAYKSLNRQQILDFGQEKCLEVYHSTKHALHPRDLRVLIPDSTSSEPTIIVNKLSCLVSLGVLHALILYDRLYLVLPNGADALIQLFRSKMEELLQGIQAADSNASLMIEHDSIFNDGDMEDQVFAGEDALDTTQYHSFPTEVNRPRQFAAPEIEDSEELLLQQKKRTITLEELRREARTRSVDQLPSTPTVSQHQQDLFKTEPVNKVFEIQCLEALLWTALRLLERQKNSLVVLILMISKE